MLDLWWLAGVMVGMAVLGGSALALLHRQTALKRAQKMFLRQREHLEAKFMSAAAATGKPRGLRWKQCDWERDVAFARERSTGQLTALVAVTIQFEAIAGSDMEGLPAVGNLRNASAVFCFGQGRWHTSGRAVFNLNPAEAVNHFRAQYELLAPASGTRCRA